jgi:hypothetical protein
VTYDRNKYFYGWIDEGEPAPKKRKYMRQVSPKQRQKNARDARVKKRLIEIHGYQCFFGAIGWPDCATYTIDERQEIEHMHIYGKRIGHKQLTLDSVRYNTGFAVLGCWKHHDMHENEEIVIIAEPKDGEVYRSFEWGDLFYEDTQPWEVVI